MPRPGKNSGHHLAGFPVFPIQTGEAGRIHERPGQLLPGQKTFLIQTVQRGHYRGVGQWTVQQGDDILNAALSARPQDFHHGGFQMTEVEAPHLD